MTDSPSTEPRPEKPDPEPPGRWALSWPLFLVLGAILIGTSLWRASTHDARQPSVDYSVFYAWLQADKVRSVVLRGSELEGELDGPEAVPGGETRSFRTLRPVDDETLLPLLHAKRVQLRVASEDPSMVTDLFMGLLPWLLIIVAWMWLARRAQNVMVAGGGGLRQVLGQKSRRFERSEAVNVTFDDVAGLGSAKRDLQEVVQFLKEPERYQRLGGKVPRGVLLVGPPGTGKTLLARAVAGESGVPFFSISASEFIELFVGVGAARVRELFEEAKNNAPAIIFIDELDAVGRARGAGLGGGHDEREQTLNQLLSEMDGFERHDLTVVLAATNRPDVLDPALLRPGRFDRRVIVDRPERSARRSILDVHVRKKPLASDVDLDAVAVNTVGFSGADLANLVNEAALHATRREADAIAAEDFAEAFDKIVLGDPREAKLGPDEKRRIAVHEGGHAVVAQYSALAELPQRITIIPRGMALGATQRAPAEDRHLMTQPELEAHLRVLMGGYAAEKLVLGCISTGAEKDLEEATKLASKMVAHYGMSDTLGPVFYEHDVEHPFLGRRMATDGGTSDATTHAIEEEARKLLSRALEAARATLERQRAELDRLIEALLERETLERGDLTAIFEPRNARPSAAVPREPAAPASRAS